MLEVIGNRLVVCEFKDSSTHPHCKGCQHAQPHEHSRHCNLGYCFVNGQVAERLRCLPIEASNGFTE